MKMKVKASVNFFFYSLIVVILVSTVSIPTFSQDAKVGDQDSPRVAPSQAPSKASQPDPARAGPRGRRAIARPPRKSEADLSFPTRITYDLGVSAGSTGGLSYTEAELGLNLFYGAFLDFRNAAFARFMSGASNVYGLDSSVRGILSLGSSLLGFTAFAGPGIRFQTVGSTVPFAEAGAIFKLPGLTLGGGAKTLFNSAITSGAPNDTQFFIILSGGGTL